MRSNSKKSRKKKKKERWNWGDQSKAVMTPMTERITFKQFLEGYGRGRYSEYGPIKLQALVDPSDDDSDVRDVEAYIVYDYEGYQPATRHDPAEGGVSVEYIQIGDKKIYDDKDLEAVGVYDWSYEGLVDKYTDIIFDEEYGEQQGYY